MLRVRGDSMKDAGIMDGSVVLVDKAIQPRNGHVVVACIDNEYPLHIAVHQRSSN